LVPGEPSTGDLLLANYLRVPVLGSAPTLASLTTKAAFLNTLMDSCSIPRPPSSTLIFKPTDVAPQLGRLIAENKHVERWVFKIDGESCGRGIAYFDVVGCEPLSKVIRLASSGNRQNFQNDHELQTLLNMDEEGLNEEILRLVARLLPKKLVIVKEFVYKDYYQFIEEISRKGGIIEAAPSSLRKDLNTIGILFQLEPDGEVEIQTTYEKLSSSPFCPSGFRFPQKVLPNLNVRSIVESLASELYKKGHYGFYSIELLVFTDPFTKPSPGMHASDQIQPGLFWANSVACKFSEAHAAYVLSSVLTGRHEANLDKHITVLPHLSTDNLPTCNFKSFFHMTRVESLFFDVQSKTGVLFLLSQGLQAGLLGVICISSTFDANLSSILRTLAFLREQTQVKTASLVTSNKGGRTMTRSKTSQALVGLNALMTDPTYGAPASSELESLDKIIGAVKVEVKSIVSIERKKLGHAL
jgi:IQ domain-containing protein H